MHRTLVCVGNTQVLELCPAQWLGNEQIGCAWRICVLEAFSDCHVITLLNRYGLTKRTHLPPASLNTAETTWYGESAAQRMC